MIPKYLKCKRLVRWIRCPELYCHRNGSHFPASNLFQEAWYQLPISPICSLASSDNHDSGDNRGVDISNILI